LVAFGDSFTSSIPDYYYVMRSRIIHQASAAIKAGLNFNGMLKPDKDLALIHSFNPAVTPKNAPTLKVRLRKAAENRWMHLIYRTKLYQGKTAKAWEHKPTADDRIVFRLWLLCRYLTEDNA
jgi:hypothetical protein